MTDQKITYQVGDEIELTRELENLAYEDEPVWEKGQRGTIVTVSGDLYDIDFPCDHWQEHSVIATEVSPLYFRKVN